MKRVFITGLTGFAGSHLAEWLSSAGYDIYGSVFGNTPLPTIPAEHQIPLNLMDRDATMTAICAVKPQWIFHLAALSSPAQSFVDPRQTMTNNIEAEINIMDAAREVKELEKLLVVGSAEEYGKVAEADLPINEDAPLRPLSPYAVSKIAQDFLGYQYHLSYGLPVVRVRPFNHTGERQAPLFVVPAFAKQIAEIEAGKQSPVLKVGNLEAVRDFTDVKDMVKAYALAMDKGMPGEVYNLGRGTGIKIKAVLDQLLALAATSITVETDPARMQPSDVPQLVCDAGAFTALTGWRAEIPFGETLKRVLDYWRETTK